LFRSTAGRVRCPVGVSDGVTGDVDLSHLAGRGVFKLWDQYENFKKVSIVDGRRLAWSDAIDLDADSLYLRLTGKAPEDIFPFLKEYTSYAEISRFYGSSSVCIMMTIIHPFPRALR